VLYVYPQFFQISNNADEWLRERAILEPENYSVNIIYEKIISMFETNRKTPLTDQNQAVDIPIEFLNSLNPLGLPPYKLDLKIGAPIILMRNLTASKSYNETRLRDLS